MENDNLPKYKIAIVSSVTKQPTKEWIQSLQSSAKEHSIIIVTNCRDLDLPTEWEEVIAETCPFPLINFGNWHAYREGYDIIIDLDEHCLVTPDFIAKHLEGLMSNSSGWENPIKDTSYFPRGFPYHERMKKTILNMGLTEGIMDIGGRDVIKRGRTLPSDPKINEQQIAHGIIPLSGLNFAIHSYALPALFILPDMKDGQLNLSGYGDIFGGYIFQKLMQKTHEMIRYGFPIVNRRIIFDIEGNAEDQADSITFEDSIYQIIDIICNEVNQNSYDQMFKEFVNSPILEKSILKSYIPSLKAWVNLFETKHEA